MKNESIPETELEHAHLQIHIKYISDLSMCTSVYII